MNGWLHAALAALALAAAPVAAQVPRTLPNLDIWAGGTVDAVVRAADGSVIVGGEFSTVYDPASALSVDRANLARFTPAGALDLAWDTGTDGPVLALALDASGNVYVGGAFATVDGTARASVAKLVPGGSVDSTWNPGANGAVHALAVDSTGAVIAGGAFTAIGGAARGYVAKLAGTGSGAAVSTWAPALNAPVHALVPLADDGVVAGGEFTTVFDPGLGLTISRESLVKLAASGAIDFAWDPFVTGRVRALARDGVFVYAGGEFTAVDSVARMRLAKIALAGGALDATWDPGANGTVRALATDGAGALYAGGEFGVAGGAPRLRAARLATAGAGGADAGWNVAFDDAVRALALGGGAVHLGGEFTRAATIQALGYARTDTSGTALAAPLAQSPPVVDAVVRAADGRVYAGGRFARVDGAVRGNLLRLNADGSFDATWQCAVDGEVFALAVMPSGPLFVGGAFANAFDPGLQLELARPNLAKFDSGALDFTWQASTDGPVRTLAMDAASLYVGGEFAAASGVARARLARVAQTGAGTLDTNWNPSAAGTGAVVLALAFDFTGLYVGGRFDSIGGAARANVAKVSASTGLAIAGWDAGADGPVRALRLAAGGNGPVFAGGEFLAAGGLARRNLAKLSGTSGAADPAWAADTSAGAVRALALDVDGGVLAGGGFVSVGGLPRLRLAKLSAATGGVVADWTAPVSGNDVRALAVGPDGVVHAGGDFARVAGAFRRALAALLPDALFGDGFE